MLHGISGDLVSRYFAEELLDESFAGELGEATRDAGRKALMAWWRTGACRLGPASSVRKVFDEGAVPLLETLGYAVSGPRPCRSGSLLAADALARAARLTLVVGTWGESLDRAISDSARESGRSDSAWVLAFNGLELRLSDARRLYARRHLAFDLQIVLDHDAAFAAFWALAHADAIAPASRPSRDPSPAIDTSRLGRIVDRSAAHAVQVCASLREGVREALVQLLEGLVASSRRGTPLEAARKRLPWTCDQALTLVYRLLFLLFAEARGIAPVWQPIYRASYSVASLCEQAERPGRATGLWEGLQAMSRLAHGGCSADGLRVTPFNGRLFSPRRAPLAETRSVDDERVRMALLALATQAGGGGRRRVAFRDLGVEQLGSVYESVLDYEPAVEKNESRAGAPRTAPRARWKIGLVGRGDRRKASGTFYTPRSITEFVVRQTLHPLVDGAAPEEILRLRVLDPAMGSGAFLVASCRYLAGVYEAALVRDGGCHPSDITDADRAGFRRRIAERCLYGVDLNPAAVQVARLSLWLTTLSADRPLTFLDHRLAVGNSLVGATLDDIVRLPGRTRRASSGHPDLPLFDTEEAGPALQSVMPIRHRLAEPDDKVSVVHEKERLLAAIGGSTGELAKWKAAADLWCSRWFWNGDRPAAPSTQELGDLIAMVVGRRSALPRHVAMRILDTARRLAEELRFFHWTLEFPEAFFDANGQPASNGGFDAIVGNPPWDMIRGDAGDASARIGRREAARHLTRFVRDSGVYKANGDGHGNLYQLFVERSVQLARRGGRIGLVLPWGLASDHGCAPLRRLLLERCRTDMIVSFENTDGIFPIHRGVRFLLLTATAHDSSTGIPCLFGARDPAVLENLPAAADVERSGEHMVSLSADLLRRMSGPDLVIPHVKDREELVIAERLSASFPALGDDPRGYGVKFGRELNATDDRRLFRARGTVPVVEGKHIEPFVVHLDRCTRFIAWDSGGFPGRLRQLCQQPRLAYRDVAASTNRLTLIAAIVPAHAVTVHTLFCSKRRMSADRQSFLCAILNSFVANFLVRLRVTTHLGVASVERLPVPMAEPGETRHDRIVALAAGLEGQGESSVDAYVRLQAEVAHLYGLSGTELRRVLDSFPLIDPEIRAKVENQFG